MASRRQRKLAELLHEEISGILHLNTQDPRLGMVTVTGVEVTADLLTAQVYVTVLGDESDAKEAMTGLSKAGGYIRYQLGKALSLRRVPDLTFKLDHSLEYALHIENLLNEVKDDLNPSPSDLESD